MKKFSKIMLSVAAVSAMTAAMAVSAMAADVTAEYDTAADNGTVTIKVANPTGTSQTLLVLTQDAETVAEADIAQIDQKDDGTSFTEFKLPAGIYAALGEGQSKTYYIRIGGSDGKMQTGTLTISKGGGSEEDTVQIMIGDIDDTKAIDMSDVTALARGNAGEKKAEYNNESVGKDYTVVSVESGTYTGSTLKIGDIDGTTEVDMSDVTALARGNAGEKKAEYNNLSVGAVVKAKEVK